MNKLVVHFAHVKTFSIQWCLFDFDNQKLSFELANNPKIEEISFEGCGDKLLNNWEENLDSLKDIMRAFKNSDVRSCIKRVNLDDCGDIDEDKIEKIMEMNQITYRE